MPDNTDFLLEFREFKGEINSKLDRAIADIANLQNNFVPRDEFQQLSRLVKGELGEGGLVKDIKDLQLINAQAQGSWSTWQVMLTAVIGIGSAVLGWIATKGH